MLKIITYSFFFLFTLTSWSQIHFIENKGQIVDQNGHPNSNALFILPLQGMNVVLTPNGFSYNVISTQAETLDLANLMENALNPDFYRKGKQTHQVHRVDIDFINSNPNGTIEKTVCIPTTKYHYYTSSTPKEGIRNIAQYEKIVYKNIYNGIDIEFTTKNKNHFEYNFILHPGANIEDIILSYHGADHIELNGSKLLLQLSTNNIEESIPASFDGKNGHPIKAQYLLENNLLRFRVEGLTPTSTFVIDPVPNLVYASYFGASAEELIFDSKMDNLGNLYLAGQTTSISNIATTGAYQTEIGGTYDVLLAKFNTSHELEWCTYMGGADWDYANAITLLDDAIFIAGTTQSNNGIATWGAYQENINGFSNGFVSRFDTSGERIWSSYFGAGVTTFSAATIADNNTLVVVGNSQATSLPFNNNAYQSTLNGPSDGFISTWSVGGIAQYCTFFGGESTESFSSVSQDANGLIWISGITRSENNIATNNALQPNFGGGIADNVIVAFTNDFQLEFATYFGDAGDDFNSDLEIANDKVIIAGQSNQPETLTTTNAQQQTSFGGSDSFYAIINENFELEYCSIIGGNSNEDKLKIEYFENELFFVGATKSTLNLSTPAAFQEDFMDAGDPNIWKIYLGKINSSNAIEWCSYFGNYGSTRAAKLHFWQNQLILTGWANTTENLPSEMQIPLSTPNALQPLNAGEEDSFFAYFDGVTHVTPILQNSELSIFPNPTSSLLNIRFSHQDNWTVDIYNIYGQLVFTEEVYNQHSTKINVLNLTSGAYNVVTHDRYNKSRTNFLVIKE